jgi:2-polyprenyl-3-methyl-5-hydroxy-6-metoxy-1,4-benzoquinol methylase
MQEIAPKSGICMVQCKCGFISVDFSKWQSPFRDSEYYKKEDLQDVSAIPPFIFHRITALKRHLPGGLVADLGSGPGYTVAALARAGYQAVGVEESQNAVTFLKDSFTGAEWRNCKIDDYLREPRIHDGLTLYHVLEHLPEPGRICRLARERLRRGGLLVIEVPDVKSGQAFLYGDRWGMFIPDHVNYFTTATLRRLLEPIGFKLVDNERKYHFAWPSGVGWKDVAHETLSRIGLHSIITTYWRL